MFPPGIVVAFNVGKELGPGIGLIDELAALEHFAFEGAVASSRAGYVRLPGEVREIADKQYRLWLENSSHPSIQFKKVGADHEDYRAAG